jgi:hypothetical protein
LCQEKKMSNQAMTWAFAQHIPSRAKTVLLSLANHADHTTGHCYPSIATIMDESSCSRRSTFAFLGLLRRNGFIDVRMKRGADGRQRASDYWILFDREPREWQHFRDADEAEPQDEIEENSTDETASEDSALCAPGSDPVENAPLDPPVAPPQSAACTPNKEPSDSNRQNPQQVEGRALKLDRPKDFSSTARADEQARLKAAEEARKPKMWPVIEGTTPWQAWIRHGHPPTLTGIVDVNGKRYRGWYFPTLYPQPKQSTGPPISPRMTAEDEEELAKKWG